MSLATILAVIDGAPGSEAALQTALQLGRRHDARVDLLHVEIEAENAVPVLGEGMSGGVIEQMVESIRVGVEKRLQEAQRLYETHCVAAGLPQAALEAKAEPGKFVVRFRHVVGSEADAVVKYGRLTDLIVVARPSEENEGTLSPALDAALFDSGRPVMVTPPRVTESFGSTAAIAWDRSAQAIRAIANALPVLAKAEKVFVMTARENDTEAEPSELAEYLACHGIAAQTWAFIPDSGAIGAALLEEAKKTEASLLVMGAYSHSRLREMVLGGTTRSILKVAEIPVFMAH